MMPTEKPTDRAAKGFFWMYSEPPTVSEIIEPLREYDEAGIPKHTIPEAVWRVVNAFQQLWAERAEMMAKMDEMTTLSEQLLVQHEGVRQRVYDLEAEKTALLRRNEKLVEQLKYANERPPDICWTCGTKP